jgi:hypothetical protein
VRAIWHYLWEDLGLEEPHPLRALLWVGAALILGLVFWGLAIIWALA